jgi:outer membrane receptor protein involved in Fe transport
VLDDQGRRYTYNYAAASALRLPLERSSAYLAGDYELDDSARVYLQALYADYTANTQLAPTPAVGVFMPASNPYIPADLAMLLASRPNAGSPFQIIKRLAELGPRIYVTDNRAYQLTLGVEGQAFGDWDYDVYALYGDSRDEVTMGGNASLSKMEELSFAADGGASLCGGFDPFGKGSISAECIDYIAVDAGAEQTYEIGVLEGNLSGALFELPAGPIELVVGALYREDRFDYRADESTRKQLPDGRYDLLGFFGSDDLRGDTREYDLYFEVLVPLLADAPLVRALEVVAGYRYADYTGAGGTDAWKAELMYRPLEPVLLRGSYQRAVRAPSVAELYQPQVPTIVGLPYDPCEAGSPERSGGDAAQVEALCLAQGLPPELLPVFVATAPSGFSGGNPDLDTESASHRSRGSG